MILKYKGFLLVNEANVKQKLTRQDLKVGDEVMTIGTFDGVNLDYQIGKVIAMREYGNILVEFEKKFSNKLHSGANEIGEKNKCYYIKLENITSNNRVEFEGILKNIDKQKREENDRLNDTYKVGDVIIGVGEITIYRGKINIDGEVGIVYYDVGQAAVGGHKNRTYWIGFLDNFDKNLIINNGHVAPENVAGYNVDKLHLRHITDEEREKVKVKLDKALMQFNELSTPLKPGDVVKFISDQGGHRIKGKIGVVITNNTHGNGLHAIHYVRLVDQDMPDYLDPILGMQYYRKAMRLATEEQIAANVTEVSKLKQVALDYNYPYKVGDWIIAYDRNDRSFDNQPGKIVKIENLTPWENYTIEFLTHFSHRIQNIGIHKNCAQLQRSHIKICKDPKLEETIKKLEAGKVKPFIASNMIITIMDRSEIRSSIPFFTQSYFDLGENVDNITFLPVDKIARLEAGETPYKSRFRQAMGVGKFIRMLQPTMKEREVELFTNSFKANCEIIKGGMDKLKLVSGELIRYWYDGENYVKGGGSLNSSCMQSKSKAPEMQMFVDNPDVIQMLILTDGDKLLGRALIWRLVEPYGQTFMDYCYTRYDQDRELFITYGKSKGWIIADLGKGVANMVCALFNNKKYKQGKDALDHFDTFNLGSTGDYCYTDRNWNRPKDLVKPKWDGDPEIESTNSEGSIKADGPKPVDKKDENKPFPINARIIYQKPGAVNNNKKGIFVGLKDDGKAKIVFDDGGKYALNVEYLKETD